MSDIKLFKITNGHVNEIDGHSVAVEKSLQTLIEQHLDDFLGVRFLSTEHSTGKKHGGRIDTLGIDENGCPVIIEYKRSLNENVINQGLFYLDWLMDHKGDFGMLVLDKLGQEEVDKIEWSMPRLLCIAGQFTKYDEYAVQQINRNIELLRYKKYGPDLMMLELVNAVEATREPEPTDPGSTNKASKMATSIEDYIQRAPEALLNRLEALKAFLHALGDDVQTKELKWYIAFKRIKNFACIEVHPQKDELLVYVKVDPETVQVEDGFTRDVRSVGHYGTGDLQIRIKSDEDLERAKQYIVQSYESN